MSVIEIIGKPKGGKAFIIDEANTKKNASQQVNYWQNLKGKGWKVFSKVT
jgi:hypothetical protein